MARVESGSEGYLFTDMRSLLPIVPQVNRRGGFFGD
jgi:hypothetical protein